MIGNILRTVRKHPDVMPVFVITCLGAGFATAAIFRACIVYTDVSFDRKNNPHPWQKVQPTQQTKFIRAYDYSKLKDERPKFDEEK